VRLITLSVAVWAAVSLAESVQSQSFTETKLIDLPDEAKLLISENGQSFAAIKKVGSRTAVDFNGQVGPRFSSIKSLQLSRNGKTVAYLGEKAGIYYPVINHTSHDPIVSEYGNLQHAYGEVILPQSDQFAFTIQPSFGNINVGLNPKLGFFVISDDGSQVMYTGKGEEGQHLFINGAASPAYKEVKALQVSDDGKRLLYTIVMDNGSEDVTKHKRAFLVNDQLVDAVPLNQPSYAASGGAETYSIRMMALSADGQSYAYAKAFVGQGPNNGKMQLVIDGESSSVIDGFVESIVFDTTRKSFSTLVKLNTEQSGAGDYMFYEDLKPLEWSKGAVGAGSGPIHSQRPSWLSSPDGKRLAIAKHVPGGVAVFVDGKAMGFEYEQISDLVFSRNSKNIAWAAMQDQTWYVVVSGDEAELPVTGGNASQGPGKLEFSANGALIALTSTKPGGMPGIQADLIAIWETDSLQQPIAVKVSQSAAASTSGAFKAIFAQRFSFSDVGDSWVCHMKSVVKDSLPTIFKDGSPLTVLKADSQVFELGFIPDTEKVYYRFRPFYGTQDFKLGIDNLATKLIQGQQPSQVAFSPSGNRFALSLEIREQDPATYAQSVKKHMLIDGVLSGGYDEVFFKASGVMKPNLQNSLSFAGDGSGSLFAKRDNQLYRVGIGPSSAMYGDTVKFSPNEAVAQVVSGVGIYSSNTQAKTTVVNQQQQPQNAIQGMSGLFNIFNKNNNSNSGLNEVQQTAQNVNQTTAAINATADSMQQPPQSAQETINSVNQLGQTANVSELEQAAQAANQANQTIAGVNQTASAAQQAAENVGKTLKRFGGMFKKKKKEAEETQESN